MENDKQLYKECLKTALIGCCIVVVVAILLKMKSIILGYLLGIVISLFIYRLDIEVIDGLLHFKSNTYPLSFLLFIFKLGIYAIGFFVAVKIPVIFNIFGVFVGYLNTKLTIYRLALIRR